MPDYPLPPWLQGNPSQFVPEQYAKGLALGIQEAAQQQQAAMEQQRLDLARESAEREQQERDVQNQINRQKLEMSLDAAKRKVAAIQTHKQMVDAGVDPVDAWIKLGPQLGTDGSDISAMARGRLNEKRASMPLEYQEIPGYGVAGRWGDRQFVIPKRQAKAPQDEEFSKQDMAAQKAAERRIDSIDRQISVAQAGNADILSPDTIKALRAERELWVSKLKKINPALEDDVSEEPDYSAATPPSLSSGNSGIKILSIEQVD